MALLTDRKFIHFNRKSDFEALLNANAISDKQIVFLKDAQEIWTHGTYYGSVEQFLDETNKDSTNAVSVAAVYKALADDEKVIAAALNDLNDKYTNLDSSKQDVISDLDTIRENAQSGASKVSNVQADWNAESGLAQILHKPDLSVYENKVTSVNGQTGDVEVVVPQSLLLKGITPRGHTLADTADSYYANELNNGEAGAWFISYSNGDILVKSNDTSKDQDGRVCLSSSWKSRLNYGGMTWANVGDILLVYKQSSLIVVYKVMSINEAGETRIGLMSPNDKIQVNKISNIEGNVNNLLGKIDKRLPYSTDSTNIGNAGNGAYTNVTAGRTNWLDTSTAGAAIKLGNLQIAIDNSGRLYSRNQTNNIWNVTNQLKTITETDLNNVFEPSVIGYATVTNGPSETGNYTVYTFTSSDYDGNGFRSILQIAINRNSGNQYMRTCFKKVDGSGTDFTSTDWKLVSPSVTSVNGQTGAVTITETQLSKGTATGTGNAVTDINVSNHQITLVKGATYATQSDIDTSIANLVDSAPETLDTLNELAAALGDDPNFATTVANQIGQKYTKPNTGIPASDLAAGVIPAAPGTLNTTATTAQTTSSSEALSGSITLHKVAKTGTYNDLIGKPTIPAAVTESTISGWGFTKLFVVHTDSEFPTTDGTYNITVDYTGNEITAAYNRGEYPILEFQDKAATLPIIGLNGIVNFGTTVNKISLLVGIPSDSTNANLIVAHCIGPEEISHQSIKFLNTTNTSAQHVNESETIAGSGTINLHKVSKTGSYSDLIKPSTGIPKTDLASTVQTSLGKADSAIQGVKVNGTSVTPDSNKIVDITIPEGELSNNYEPSSLDNEDLELAAGDTYEEAFGKLEKSINDNEQITAAALTDLDSRINTLHLPQSLDDIPDGSTRKLSDYATTTLLATKQDALVSGTNIKTINNESLLGSGNITIQGGSGGDTNVIETVKVNGTALTPDANKAVNIDLSSYDKAPLVIEVDDGDLSVPNGTYANITQALSQSRQVLLKVNSSDTYVYVPLVYDLDSSNSEYYFGAISGNASKSYAIDSYNTFLDYSETISLNSSVVHKSGTETITGNKTFTGTVTLGSNAVATTPTVTDNDTSVATTAFVQNRINNGIDSTKIIYNGGIETIVSNGDNLEKVIEDLLQGVVRMLDEDTGNANQLVKLVRDQDRRVTATGFSIDNNNVMSVGSNNTTKGYKTFIRENGLDTFDYDDGFSIIIDSSDPSVKVSASGNNTYYRANAITYNNNSLYFPNKSGTFALTSDIPSAVTESTVSGWGFTKNAGTITGITMNGASKGTSGVVDLGTVITSETALSKGTTTGNGNAVTDISVNGHQITLTKGTTFLTSHQGIKTLKTDNTTAQSTSSSEAIAGSGTINLHKVAKTGTYSDLIGKPTIPTVNNATLTIQKNGTTVNTFTANASSNVTANIQVNELPTVSSSDNGKVLMVVNGAWTLVTPTAIYSGSSTPDNTQGNNGDLYLQTS